MFMSQGHVLSPAIIKTVRRNLIILLFHKTSYWSCILMLLYQLALVSRTKKASKIPYRKKASKIPTAQWVKNPTWSLCCGSVVTNPTSIHKDTNSTLALLGGLMIWCCRELWYKSQTWLRFHVAMAVVQACSCSADSAPSLGTSICHRCGPKKKKKYLTYMSTEGRGVKPYKI